MSTRESRRQRFALLIGYVAFVVALQAAISAPAQGYELSIYRATPDVFWVGIAVAVVAAAYVSFSSTSTRPLVGGGLLLAGSAVWSVLALPLIRGYFFYSGGDGLSHLGFARSFATRAMSPVELLHPGMHLSTLLVSEAAAFSIERAMVLVVFVFVAVFLVFVPLCVRLLTRAPHAAAFGLFLALFLVPLNDIATHVYAHPTSQAIMFLPLVLYLLFRYLQQDTGPVGSRSPVGLLLVPVSLALVLIHPEEAMNTIAIFGAIVLIQFVARRVAPDHRIATQRSLYFQTAFLTSVFLLWAPRSPRVQSRVDRAYQTLFVSRTTPGGEVTERAGSLLAVGGSIEELFVKLFLVATVLSVVAGLFMLASLTGRLDGRLPERNAFGKYMVVAFVPLVALTIVVFVGSFGDHYFRFIGFLLVIVTILAAAGIAVGVDALRSPPRRAVARTVVVVLLLLALPLTTLAIHPSPWIFQPNGQVTETSIAGYETAFDTRDPNVTFVGVRGGTSRYVEAIYGPESPTTDSFPLDDDGIPERVFATNLTTYYGEERYVPVTTSDVQREVQLYEGFRYSKTGFDRLTTTPGVSRVQATGEFRLYLVADESE